VGIDVFALVTEWEPAVGAFREAGGLDFYWDANVARNDRYTAGADSDDLPELPYLTEVDVPGGKGFLEPAAYYDQLREHLPPSLRDPADALFGMIVPGDDFYEWISEDRDDIVTDSGVSGGGMLYSFRPATAAAVAALTVPWDDLAAFAEAHPVHDDGLRYFPQWSGVEWVVQAHHRCAQSAAEQGRGVIMVLSV
jgi:hypothetical protein